MSTAQQDLCDAIVRAREELKKWREDGNADKIFFYAARVNELLDKYLELR